MIKAKKVDILLGKVDISVYQLPNGEYRLSQTQITETIDQDEISFRHFLKSKAPEALPYKGCKFDKIQEPGAAGRPPNGVPIKVASVYWLKESSKGNKTASKIIATSLETLI